MPNASVCQIGCGWAIEKALRPVAADLSQGARARARVCAAVYATAQRAMHSARARARAFINRLGRFKKHVLKLFKRFENVF